MSGSNIFAGTYDDGVFLSTNNGTSWTAVNSGLTDLDVYSLAVSGSTIFAGTDSGLWRAQFPAVPVLASPINNAQNQQTSLSLSWASVSSDSSYVVQVSTVATFASTVMSQRGLTANSASITGLANSLLYYWRVGSKDAFGFESGWSSVWSFGTIIATPSLSSPANGARRQATSLTMNWGMVTGATSYSIQIATVSTFASTVSSQTGVTDTSLSLTGLANSTTYYWEVNATNGGGTSGWSSVWNFRTIIAAPSAPELSSPTNNAQNQPISLTLSWSTSALSTSYEVQVSLLSTFGTTSLISRDRFFSPQQR